MIALLLDADGEVIAATEASTFSHECPLKFDVPPEGVGKHPVSVEVKVILNPAPRVPLVEGDVVTVTPGVQE